VNFAGAQNQIRSTGGLNHYSIRYGKENRIVLHNQNVYGNKHFPEAPDVTNNEVQKLFFPYKLDKLDLLMVPLGLGMIRYGYSLMDGKKRITYQEISRLRPEDVPWFDRGATNNWSQRWRDRSDVYRDLVLRATYLYIGLEGVNLLFQGKFRETATLATMFVESYLFTWGVITMTKPIVGRKRPIVFNTDLSVEQRYGMTMSDDDADVLFSFFSGHAAGAFATATFLSKVFTDLHGRSIWSDLVWGSTLSAATMAAHSRVKAGKHFPSDVIAGAVAGSAIGYMIPVLHKKNEDHRLGFSVAPNRAAILVRF
jgi:membrane-associated phospholipid phosphatase